MKSRLRPAPPPPGKAGKKRRRALKGFILLLFFLGAGLLLYKASGRFWQVQEITVTGTVRLGEAEVISQSGIKKGTGFLLLKAGRVEKKVALLPLVRSAAVKKNLPAAVRIAVQERVEAACLLDQHRFWLIDEEGVIFAEQPHTAEGLPVITGVSAAEISLGKPLNQVKKSAALRIFLEALRQVPLLEPAELNISDPDDLVLYTAEGCRVLLGDDDEMEDKLVLLHAYLQEGGKGDCLDLRTGDRLVVLSGEGGG